MATNTMSQTLTKKKTTAEAVIFFAFICSTSLPFEFRIPPVITAQTMSSHNQQTKGDGICT